MTALPFSTDKGLAPRLGLVVLQADETIEGDFRRLCPAGAELLVSRVPSGEQVTPESLAQMEAHLTAAAALFPRGARFAVTGYGCTSGAAQIGPARVAALVRAGAPSDQVTEPVSALIAACRAMGLTRLAFLSPYVETVSGRLLQVLERAGVATPVFGSFEEPHEATVARIDAASILAAGLDLARGTEVDALFLSCTNLRTLDVIAPLEAALGLPVLSSNLVLAWHMLRAAGLEPGAGAPGRLWDTEGRNRA